MNDEYETAFWKSRYEIQHKKIHAMEDFIAELREIIARASRMAEQERAEMTQQILQEGLR